MNYKTIMGFCLIGAACFSCKQGVEQKQEAEIKDTHKTVFAKGDKITNDHFIGTVWLEMLVREDSINQNSVGSVTFEPGARTNWHSHPNGQIILAIEGEGFYQEKGSPKNKTLFRTTHGFDKTKHQEGNELNGGNGHVMQGMGKMKRVKRIHKTTNETRIKIFGQITQKDKSTHTGQDIAL